MSKADSKPDYDAFHGLRAYLDSCRYQEVYELTANATEERYFTHLNRHRDLIFNNYKLGK
jgi:hypothetical protein